MKTKRCASLRATVSPGSGCTSRVPRRWLLGAEEETVALFRRSIENNRTIPLTHFFLAATLANLGKLEEAEAEAKAGLALDPGFSIVRFRSGGENDNPTGKRLMEGMRKAGVPLG